MAWLFILLNLWVAYETSEPRQILSAISKLRSRVPGVGVIRADEDERRNPKGNLLVRFFMGNDCYEPVVEIQHSGEIKCEDLACLKEFPKLKVLFLGDSHLPDEAMEYVGSIGSLEILFLPDAPITNEGLLPLVNLGRLETLDISGTKVTDSGADILSHVFSLRTLILRHLNVGDHAVASMKSLPQLEVLVMSHTKATDLCMTQLMQYPCLNCVDLSYTRVSRGGVEYLRKHSAGVRVEAYTVSGEEY
jgi:Leucine-rich repeat (LRR) protein